MIQARSYIQARGGSCLLIPRRLNFFDTQINVMRNCEIEDSELKLLPPDVRFYG